MGAEDIVSFAHAAFSNGYAETGVFPVPASSKMVCLAAIKTAEEFWEDATVLDFVRESGRKEGLVQTVTKRRKKLYAHHMDRAREMSKRLGAEMPMDEFTSMLVASVTEDNADRRKTIKQDAELGILALLGKKTQTAAEWREIAAEARAQAVSEGFAEGTALIANFHGIAYDLDKLYDDTLDQLRDLSSYWTGVDGWVSSQISGLAGDIGSSIADGLDAGLSRDEIQARVGDVLDAGDGAAFYMDEAVHTAMSMAMLGQYQDAGVMVDYCIFDANACQTCQGFSAASPYEIGSAPSIPQHAGCRCWYAPAGTVS